MLPLPLPLPLPRPVPLPVPLTPLPRLPHCTLTRPGLPPRRSWENSFAIASTTRQGVSFTVGMIVLLHWLACAYALLPQLMTSWRLSTNAEQLEAGVLRRIAAGEECTGCIAADLSTAALCESDCVTACEIREIAQLGNYSEDYVFFQQNWMCRGRVNGFLNNDIVGRKGELYLASLFVAMMQLVRVTVV